MSNLKENLTKLINKFRTNNPTMFLPYENILDIIKHRVQNDLALQVLIPNFDEYFKLCSRPLDAAQHESIVVMGIRNSDLDVVLDSIRQFILDAEGKFRARKQYISDLSELHWLDKRTEAERYHAGNSFKGRIYELILAGWLSKQGYAVINLEAWSETSSDIVIEQNGVRMNVQVKYIAQYKKYFEQDCESYFAPRAGFIDCNSTANNFERKVNEAAQELQSRSDGLRVAAIIIDNREIGAYFIAQENCCRNDSDVIQFQKALYDKKDIDEVRVFYNQGLKIIPAYRFDIKNQQFNKI
jgi:hypothetical protein